MSVQKPVPILAAGAGYEPPSPDDAIAAEVECALSAVDCLRGAGYDDISVSVQAGVATLSGHTLTRALRERLEQAARSAPGVLGLDSGLVDDDGLAIDVAQALGRDVRTHNYPFHIVAYRGFVALRGQVDSPWLRSAAEEVAAGVPQVRGIINEVQVADGDMRSGNLRTQHLPAQYLRTLPLQPAIGQEIYASDMLLGHAARVVINRCNRLVTAVIAQGDFPDMRYGQRVHFPDSVPLEERQVVIPIGVVRYTTDNATFLSVNGATAASYADFVPSDYACPGPQWKPPYPYRPADVLFAHGGDMHVKEWAKFGLRRPRSSSPTSVERMGEQVFYSRG